MIRLQFSLKTLLWLMAVVGCFWAGINLERERQRREDEVEKSGKGDILLYLEPAVA